MMELSIRTILLYVFFAAGGIFALHGLYYAIIPLISINKPRKFSPKPASTRFAVLVAARNEEAVIGHLVDSLMKQNYPSHLYRVFVAPNNCTDQTARVAKERGATLFEPQGTITSKGQVLSQLVDKLIAENQYDAVCVFDADNLADPNFLQKMNDAYQAGAKAAQGFRGSKNPADSAISTGYSVCYWMLNQFYNDARQRLGLSALINGCGFMVSFSMLKTLGGWHTSTIIEDYEFSAQIAIAGERVQYVGDAIFYDEQPLTFSQSWKQRRRWGTGNVQSMQKYLLPLLKASIEQSSPVALDMAMTFAMPMVQLASLFTGTASTLLWLSRAGSTLAWSHWIAILAASILLVLIISTLFVIYVILTNQKSLKGMVKGIAYFSIFILSWSVINLISIFKPQTKWIPIQHTRTMQIGELTP